MVDTPASNDESNQLVKLGLFLSQKDIIHLSIPEIIKDLGQSNIVFVNIDPFVPLLQQGYFSFIIHKASDYLKGASDGDQNSIRILKDLKEYSHRYPNTIFIDPLSTVLDLADRSKMFTIMDACKFSLNGITVDVPRWTPLYNSEDVERLKKTNIDYPLICKIMCAGENPDAHSMQLIFNRSQLDQLKVFPCVAQEFKNHDAVMSKIFVLGPEYFLCTRPSVRNFPLNGIPLSEISPICFHSHDVAKLSSKDFLNNYQQTFTHKSSFLGDKVLDEKVVDEIIRKLSIKVPFNFIGIDILVSDGGKRYYLVDVNYLPSYDGVDHRGRRVWKIIKDMCNNKKYVSYWIG